MSKFTLDVAQVKLGVKALSAVLSSSASKMSLFNEEDVIAVVIGLNHIPPKAPLPLHMFVHHHDEKL